jgi:type II secretory pathway component PulM
MQKLKNWFFSLQTRERLMVTAGAVIAVVAAIYVLGLAPFYTAIGERAERVARKEGDLAWMRSAAGEMTVLNATSAVRAAPGAESLVVLIDRAARECGLGAALTGQTPNGADAIRVRLESAEFDKLMVCLGNLQQVHAISVESATIDRTATPGLVNASLVLNRAG